MKKQITWGYRCLYTYVRWFYTRLYCRTWEVRGRDELPKGQPLLFVSNHQNNLPDGLSLLFASHCKPVFVARADFFNHPKANWALRFLRILPMYRADHGQRSLVKRLPETMHELRNELLAGGACVIMAEGSSAPSRAVRPFKKGWARLYAEVVAKHPDAYVVPTALEYSDWDHWGPDVRVTFGKPLQYTQGKEESTAQFTHRINTHLQQAVSQMVANDAQVASWHEVQNQRFPAWTRWMAAPFYGLSLLLYAPVLFLSQHRVKTHSRKDFRSTLELGFIGLGSPVYLLLLFLITGFSAGWSLALGLVLAGIWLPMLGVFYRFAGHFKN